MCPMLNASANKLGMYYSVSRKHAPAATKIKSRLCEFATKRKFDTQHFHVLDNRHWITLPRIAESDT